MFFIIYHIFVTLLLLLFFFSQILFIQTYFLECITFLLIIFNFNWNIIDLQCLVYFSFKKKLAAPWGMQYPGFLTSYGTYILCIGKQSLNYWTTGEVSLFLCFNCPLIICKRNKLQKYNSQNNYSVQPDNTSHFINKYKIILNCIKYMLYMENFILTEV